MGDMATPQVVTLGGGCFWCLDAAYREIVGVTRVVSGYAGGSRPNPTYQQVCTGATGHAEVVQVEFDPDVVSFDDILGVFWSIHDPTTLNRQGADVGTQYRSVIFYAGEEQRARAEASRDEVQKLFSEHLPMIYFVAPRIYVAHSARVLNLAPSESRPQLLWRPEMVAVVH